MLHSHILSRFPPSGFVICTHILSRFAPSGFVISIQIFSCFAPSGFQLRMSIVKRFAPSGLVLCTRILSRFAPSGFYQRPTLRVTSCLFRLNLRGYSVALLPRPLRSHFQLLRSLGLRALHLRSRWELDFALTFSVA